VSGARVRSARATSDGGGYDGVLKQDGAGLGIVLIPSFLLHLPLFIMIFGGFGVDDARNPLIDKDAYMVSAVVLPKAESLPDRAAVPEPEPVTRPEPEQARPDEMVLNEPEPTPAEQPTPKEESTPAPKPEPTPKRKSMADLLASVQADRSDRVRFATDPDGSTDADPLESLRAKFGKQRDPYDQLVYERIRSNWQVPKGKKLETFIRFMVEPDGRLGAPEPVQNSGDWIYDQRCLRAVTRTGTVPPPPDGKRRLITIRCYPDD
jgi:outer membrane biosynthesis protein TonB